MAGEPQDETSLDAARSVYADAVRAYEERRYKDAIDLFQRADQLSPNPAYAFNTGIAYEDMGDSASSLKFYREYLRRVPGSPDRDAVDARIERLERVLQDKGLQQVTILSDPPGALVLVDGRSMGATPWTGEIAPGNHSLTLQLRGYVEEARTFDLPPARAIDVPVTLVEETVAAPGTAAPILAAPQQVPEQEAVVRPLSCSGAACVSVPTWIVGGAGVGAIIAAGAFQWASQNAYEQAKNEPVQVVAEAHYDDSQSRQKWAIGLGVGGLVLGAAAGVMLYMDFRQPLPAQQAGLDGGCDSEGCGLLWSGAF